MAIAERKTGQKVRHGHPNHALVGHHQYGFCFARSRQTALDTAPDPLQEIRPAFAIGVVEPRRRFSPTRREFRIHVLDLARRQPFPAPEN